MRKKPMKNLYRNEYFVVLSIVFVPRKKHLELENLVFFSSLFPMMTDNDDAPQLSAETLKILQEWQKEQQENQAANIPQEDWVCS